MAGPIALETSLRDRRELRGWSQEEMARRSGLSRAGISAIETGRLVPSAAAALALAEALGCRVEDVFRLRHREAAGATWAWAPERPSSRFWRAEIDGSIRHYPSEATVAGVVPHDGVIEGEVRRDIEGTDPRRTLMIAGCDPAAGLLAAELARTAGVRLIALPRSSRVALSLLGRGLVHAAGVHLSGADEPGGNPRFVHEMLGEGYELLHVARWEEGIALAPSSRLSSVRGAIRARLRWVGREPGSGARQCLDELMERRRPPQLLASDHRGVAEAVRNSWADAGICLRLVSEEAGLGFLPVRREDYELCFPGRFAGDYRIQALLQTLRSPAFRAALGDLPGYDTRETGALRSAR